MENDHEELYLQKLRGYIFDEDKVITCAWLCKTLDLDIKSCKDLLTTFVNDNRSLKPSELAVTYVLVGTLLEGKLRSVCIVKEDDFEERKKLYKTVDKCIYSVQKSKDLDLTCISLVDMLDVNNPPERPITGSIIGENCIKRNLKVKKALPVLNRAVPTDKSKASHLFTKTVSKSEQKPVIKENSSVNGHKNEEDSKKNGNKTPMPNNKNQNKGKTAQKGGLAALFSQVATKSETKKPIKEESPEPVKMEVEEDENEEPVVKKNKFYDSDTDEEAKKVEENNKNKLSNNVNGHSQKKKNTKRPRKDNSVDRPQKKRKRIIDRNDSDSDDIFGDDGEESEEVIAESDDETVYKKAAAPILAPKNKKRSLVDKTYMDDDGYMITKKEWVYESASEDEENKVQNNPQVTKKPVQEEKPKKTDSTKEASSPTKGTTKNKNKAKQNTANQPTIMSFFKKK